MTKPDKQPTRKLEGKGHRRSIRADPHSPQFSSPSAHGYTLNGLKVRGFQTQNEGNLRTKSHLKLTI